MNIYEYLKKDHQAVDALFKKILENKNEEQREENYQKINQELLLHTEAEEETFYKVLEKKNDKNVKKETWHGFEEHDKIRAYLKKLDALDVHVKTWMSLFQKLKEAVEHHVKEEEGEFFDRARKVLSNSEAEEIAKKMDAYKKNKISSQHAA